MKQRGLFDEIERFAEMTSTMIMMIFAMNSGKGSALKKYSVGSKRFQLCDGLTFADWIGSSIFYNLQ